MAFLVEYEDLKKLLNVFYHAPYHQAVPYVNLMQGFKEAESGITLKEKVEMELALAAQGKPKEESDGGNGL